MIEIDGVLYRYDNRRGVLIRDSGTVYNLPSTIYQNEKHARIVQKPKQRIKTDVEIAVALVGFQTTHGFKVVGNFSRDSAEKLC